MGTLLGHRGEEQGKDREVMSLLKEGCTENDVLPYFVGGVVMVTCEDDMLREIGARLGRALEWAAERCC